ncbi:MAG: alpha/beta fold hydrolase [Phycisphaeraceae bacterium]|nr:alpha/beta fold hydrolase [Phycisphaeraceae bacterium]
MDVGGLALLLLLGLAIMWALVVWFTVHALTHPPRRGLAWALARSRPADPAAFATPEGTARPYETWSFRSRCMEFPVWDVPGDDESGPVLIVTPGWGDSRVVMLSRLPALLPVSRRVVMWDLAGQGDSPGIGALGTRDVEDLCRLIETVAERGLEARVLLYGYSLGAGVSIAAAAASELVAGVIAEAPYRVPIDPARNVLRNAALPHAATLRPALALLGVRLGRGLTWAFDPAYGGFDRARLAERLRCPLLVLHGSDDEVCPVEDAREVTRAAPKSRLVELPGAGHLDLWEHPPSAAAATSAIALFTASLSEAWSPADR